VNHDAVQRDLVIVDENRSVGSRTRRIIGSENLLKRRRNAREPNRRGVRVKKKPDFRRVGFSPTPPMGKRLS